MERVTVGLVGCGFAAELHVAGLAKVTGVEVDVAAVAGNRMERARAFADRHRIGTVYNSYDELLADERIDVVCVCVPNTLHGGVMLAAAQAGKHIICEKPLTGYFQPPAVTEDPVAYARTAYAEARSSADHILEAVGAAGRRLMYAENWVYAPAVTKAKNLLSEAGGSILDIRAEESHSGSHAPASKRRATAGGGAMLILGSHPVAAALHLKRAEAARLGAEPVRVASVVADTAPLWRAPGFGGGWLVSDWQDVETWATAVLTFTDATKAVISASFAMLGGVRNILEIYTTNSVVKANLTPNDSLLAYAPEPGVFGSEYLAEKLETKAGWSFASPDEDWMRGYPQEMQDFVECVAYDRDPVADGELARDVVEVVYAAYLSAESGRRIELPKIGGRDDP